MMYRYVSIDVLRGFSLSGMVACHFMLEYGNASAQESMLYFIFNHALGDFGAVWFLLLVGVSQVISGARGKEIGEINLMKKAFIRGGYVFLAGLVMAAITWGPRNMWNWDILTLIGSAYFILYFCRFLPTWSILLLATAIVFMAPWLRGTIDFLTFWGGDFIQTPIISDYLPGIMFDTIKEYQPSLRLSEIIQGFLLSGFFPIFPWLCFPLVGFVIGRRIVSNKMMQDLPFLLIIGFILIFLGLNSSYASLFRFGSSPVTDYISPLSMFPDTNTMVLLQIGQALIVFPLLFYYYDRGERRVPRTGVFVTWFNRMSRHSLTVYFIHYPLIAWPLWIILLFTGQNREQDLMGAIPAFFLGLALIALFLVCLKIWENHGNRYSLEWGLKKLTNLIKAPKT